MAAVLESKVAAVTGGGSGIGAAIARALHDAGARVVIADVSGRQEDVAEELGEGASAIHADVTRSDDVALPDLECR